MTLRTRLILAFLALALVPLLLLTTFSLDRLDRATRLWSAPAVEHALGSALEVSKTSLHRMESAVRAQAETWAEALPDVPMDDGRRAAVRAALPATALDVLQVYREVDGRWRREEDLRPEGVLDPMALDLSDRIAGALAGERAVRASEGALVGVWPDGPQRAIVAGYRVPPGFFDEVERVGVGVGFYRRFAIVSQVSRTYLLLLVIALALLLTAVAVLVATRLARGMTRPLAALEDAVQRVAAGDLSVRVEPAGARELRTLGARFNQMTDGLAEARERIKEAEREAAWREVARRLAHEFRNLLMPMGLSVNRIHRRLPAVRAEDREAMEESLASVSDAMGQLKRLTDQFEQYARLPEPRLERGRGARGRHGCPQDPVLRRPRQGGVRHRPRHCRPARQERRQHQPARPRQAVHLRNPQGRRRLQSPESAARRGGVGLHPRSRRAEGADHRCCQR